MRMEDNVYTVFDRMMFVRDARVLGYDFQLI